MDPWQPWSVVKSDGNVGNVDDLAVALHNGDESHHAETTDRKSCEEVRTTGEGNSNQESGHRNSTAELVGGGDLSFGDNFRPFIKLPDSEEYLVSLERKLQKIQKGGTKGANAESILRSLEQSKESCMIKLLSNSVEKLTVEGEFFEELKVNPLLKKLAPEKQALSAEELVHLVKADQLELVLKSSNPEEDLVNATEETTEVEGSSKQESVGETEKDKDSTENLAGGSEETKKSVENVEDQ